jgi:hypothetical protein
MCWDVKLRLVASKELVELFVFVVDQRLLDELLDFVYLRIGHVYGDGVTILLKEGGCYRSSNLEFGNLYSVLTIFFVQVKRATTWPYDVAILFFVDHRKEIKEQVILTWWSLGRVSVGVLG